MRLFQIVVLGVSLLGLVACDAGRNKTNVEIVRGMMDQINVKAQDWDPDKEDMATAMMPPEGTVPRGKPPYKYATDPIGAGKNLKNPVGNDNSPELLTTGKETFEIYCGVCHGMAGAGDGTVAEKMALRPPSLLTDKIKNYSDGRIFHIITAGQGVMGSYAGQITNEEKRWAVVNYIRTLQKK